MNLTDAMKVRIFFAALIDAISRVFNWTRIVFFAGLAAGIIITMWRTDHFHDGTWILDVCAAGVIAAKLGRWVRIEG